MITIEKGIRLDYVKLERALRDLSDSLPATPKWAAISTAEGECLRQYPTLQDGDHLAMLTHANLAQVRNMLDDIACGGFRYSINAGQDGVYLIVLLGDYLLGINFKEIASLDAVIKAVQENAAP